jgi:ketosteroid isomerase-like protein
MVRGPYDSGRIASMIRTNSAAPVRRFAILVVFVSTASVMAEQPPPGAPPSIDLPPEIARVLRDYEAAWGAGNAAALAQLFAEDGYVLPNGGPPVKGRAAIQQHYAGSGGAPLFLRAFAYAAEGSAGYILGGYRGEQGGADAGKFTLTLGKDRNGRWLIVSDMDSPNRRPTRPQ